MITSARELIASFDALSEREQREAAAELLRRVIRGAPDDISDQALAKTADDLFLDLDAREASDGTP